MNVNDIKSLQKLSVGDYQCAQIYLDAALGISPNWQSKSLNEEFAKIHQRNHSYASYDKLTAMGLNDSDQLYS